MANNKKKHYYKNRPRKQNDADLQTPLYPAEQLSKSLQELGISETTRALLEKNRISYASDLVKRTEKDMYKVQGLNKKILFEVKDALKANGMSLREEIVKDAQKTSDNPVKQTAKPQNVEPSASSKKVDAKEQSPQKSQKADKHNAEHVSKFGLSERATSQKNQKPQNLKTQSAKQKPEKLTEPLASGQWRKVLKGGKWGYSDGFKIVIPTMYDEIFAFKEGLASVEIDEKCGYIDEQNNVVIPLDYDTAMSFSEGYAMVVKGDKCGYIDKNNEVVVPFEYDAATPFENGEAKVKKDGKWGTLTADGKITWI